VFDALVRQPIQDDRYSLYAGNGSVWASTLIPVPLNLEPLKKELLSVIYPNFIYPAIQSG
jgi:hypothetical protein